MSMIILCLQVDLNLIYTTLGRQFKPHKNVQSLLVVSSLEYKNVCRFSHRNTSNRQNKTENCRKMNFFNWHCSVKPHILNLLWIIFFSSLDEKKKQTVIFLCFRSRKFNRKENKNYGKKPKLKHSTLQTVPSTKPIEMRLSSFEFDLQTEWVPPLPVTFYQIFSYEKCDAEVKCARLKSTTACKTTKGYEKERESNTRRKRTTLSKPNPLKSLTSIISLCVRQIWILNSVAAWCRREKRLLYFVVFIFIFWANGSASIVASL